MLPEGRELALLIGLPAAGKTTFARNFPDFRGFVHIEADQFAPDYRNFWKAVEVCQAQRVMLDGTFILKKARARAIALFPGARVTGYVFPFDVDGCLKRNSERVKRLDDEEVRRKAWIYQPPSIGEGFAEIVCVNPFA